jgi:hypothetical protein
MRTAIAFTLLLLLAACASSTRPANVPQPGIEVRQAGPIYFGQAPSTPVTVDIQITNRADVPIVLRNAEVSSSSSEQYTIPRYRRTFDQTIAPNETRTLQLDATAVAINTRPVNAQPLLVRTFLLFEANGKTFREAVITEFSPVP